MNESEKGKKYILVGHSKGGNEALYTYIKMKEERLDDVIAVYNFDGPGFLDKIQETPRYKATKDKVHTFVPSDSIVGMLLEHEEDYKTVKSNSEGIKQHNPLPWEVKRNVLVTDIKNEWVRDVADNTFSDFLNQMTLEDRKFVTEKVFSIVNLCGAKSFVDLQKNTIKNTKIIWAAYTSLPEEHKEKLLRASKCLGLSWASSYRNGINEVKNGDDKPLLKLFFKLIRRRV